MLSKENIRKQVADNQVDYERSSTDVEVSYAESTIKAMVDYENRLSSEELQRGRSQESPGVTRSSSASSNSVWYSASNDTANGVSLTDDEIMKIATFFVKTFVKEFEEKLSECSKEAKPGSRIRKVGKTVDQFTSIVDNLTPQGLYRLSFSKFNEGIGSLLAKEHRKKAKSVSIGVVSFKDKVRESLVESSLEIFQKFEKQFTEVVDVNQPSWERGIEKLAMDAASRIINYIASRNEKGESLVFHITKGVVLGKSKRKHPFTTRSGHQVKDKQSGEMLMTSELYENVGIKKIEGETIKYYQLQEYVYAEKCNYRLPFAWELEKWEEVEQKYVLSEISGERYVYILDEEKKKGLASSILKEINGNDPTRKKDIEELHEEIKNLRIRHEKEGKNTFSFSLGCLPKFFIKRKIMLGKLKEKLSSKNQEEEMSRMVLIHGKYGTGKSELARSCAYSKEGDSNIWAKVIWINAETCDTLLYSFRNLAKELEIPTNTETEMEGQNTVHERKIESIIKDIYQYFLDVKSLFIFDNASEYKEIKKFLPSHFSNLFFHREKPYVLITSRNKNWKEGIEKIDLDNGFSLGETIIFIERSLGIDEKGRSQGDYLVELAKALCYLPLALAQATAYIKQENINISEYLKRYNEAMQESNPDYLKAQGISKELFITLKVNFDKIREEKNIGRPACNILYCMAYLNPNQIDIEEIFLQKKSKKDKQQILDALDRLHKFSVIELEESIARVHMGVQKTIRLEKEQAGTEEETLRNIMKSFCPIDKNHITSIWSYISKYDRLVNSFIKSNDDGSTVLHILAKDGNEEVIRLILEKIDPNKLSKIINAIDKENLTALDYAAMHGHLDIVKYLIGKGSNFYHYNDELTPLHWAVVCGQLEIVKYFIDNEYLEFDKLSEEGNTPLYYAIKYGHLDIVKYLVEKGVSVNLQDEDDVSPLCYAIKYGCLDIVKYLVEKGASINLQDEYGMSPLHYAVNKNGCLDIIKYLVEKGASVNLQDEYGMSPLHYAAIGQCVAVAQYLITHEEVDVDLKDDNNNTPLDCAVIMSNLHITKCLLKLRAKMSQKSKDFLYYYAAVNGYSDIIHYLKAYSTVYSVLDLKIQSHKRHLKTPIHLNESKKRKLENISTTSEENASNMQLFQGSQNPPSDMSMQFEGLADRTKSMVNINSEMPAYSFNSVAVELVNNKNLKGSNSY